MSHGKETSDGTTLLRSCAAANRSVHELPVTVQNVSLSIIRFKSSQCFVVEESIQTLPVTKETKIKKMKKCTSRRKKKRGRENAKTQKEVNTERTRRKTDSRGKKKTSYLDHSTWTLQSIPRVRIASFLQEFLQTRELLQTANLNKKRQLHVVEHILQWRSHFVNRSFLSRRSDPNTSPKQQSTSKEDKETPKLILSTQRVSHSHSRHLIKL